jgi:dimethylargininase
VQPLALIRRVPESFVGCVSRRPPVPPLDPALARRQQVGYRARLEEGGFAVAMLAADEAHPDCAFVEDTAVVLGRSVLITRPGHPTRRGEVGPVAGVLAGRGLSVTIMEAPATLDGGDVLRAGKHLFVGDGERSNAAGRAALEAFAAPREFRVTVVPVHGVLHLKSAATALDERTVLAFPGAVAIAAFHDLRVVPVGGDDPEAANVVRLPDGRVLVTAHRPESAAAVAAAGFTPVACDVSEFARADGGLTCLSVRLRGGLARDES